MDRMKQWLIFLVCAIAVFMVDVDLTAVNLVLSKMASALGVSLVTMQWIIDGYMIAAASLMAFGGHLADVVGYRRVFLSGLLVFGLASAGVGLSGSATEMIVFRIIQGACIAFTFPISLVVVRFSFPDNQQGFVIGLMVAIAGLSQAIGPTFGAWMITYFDWRMIFLINVPLSFLCLVAAYCMIPKSSVSAESRKKIHVLPVGLFCVSLLLLMYGLNEAPHWGLLSLRFMGCFLVSIAMLAWFVRIENKSETPVLNVHLFKQASFRQVNMLRFLLSFVYFTLLFTLSVLLQHVLHYSVLDAGYFLLLLTLVLGVLSIPAGKLVDILGAKNTLMLGAIFFVIGMLVLSSFYIDQSIIVLVASFVFLGISFALTIPSSGTVVMMSVKPEQAGAGMGIFFTTSFVGGSVGIAISSFLLHYFSNKKMMHLLNHSAHSLSHAQMSSASFSYGFSIVMFLSTVLAVIALLNVMWLRRLD